MVKKIGLTNSSKKALVDASAFDFLNQWSWYLTSHGYVARTQYFNKNKSIVIYMHHHVIGHSKKTDHIDGNKINNTYLNLRPANSAQNKFNAGKHRDNTSGYKGVCWSKQHKKWLVQIQANGIKKYVGLFADKEEAAKAYDRYARKMHGPYAKLNFA